MSLARLVREIVDEHIARGSAPRTPRGFEPIFDLFAGRRGSKTDVAGDVDAFLAEAVREEHSRDMQEPPRPRTRGARRR